MPWGALVWLSVAFLSVVYAFTVIEILAGVKIRCRTPLDVLPGFPFVGHAVSIALHGAAFIRECRLKYGDAFTLYLAGRKTFLFKDAALAYFFTAPEDMIAFRPAVEQFTHRVFGLPSAHFFPQHETMLRTLRSLLGPDQLPKLACSLLGHMQPLMSLHMHHMAPVDLTTVVCDILFGASVASLFGARFVQRHGRSVLQKHFRVFESGFELAASPVPHWMQPMFCHARRCLVHALRVSMQEEDFEGTVVGQLLESCSLAEEYAPNMLLAVLWASQANTLPASLWCIAFLLLPEQAPWRQAIMRSVEPGVREVVGSNPAADALIMAALDTGGPLSCAVAETVRLRAPGIDVRMTVADSLVPSACACPLLIPKGRVVAISPYESHMDPRLFWPHPEAYDPARPGIGIMACPAGHVGLAGSHDEAHSTASCGSAEAAGAVVDGGRPAGMGPLGGVPGVHGVAGLSFGGGRYRCPGRRFAEMEVALVTGLLLSRFHIELLSATSPRLPTPPPQDASAAHQNASDLRPGHAAGHPKPAPISTVSGGLGPVGAAAPAGLAMGELDVMCGACGRSGHVDPCGGSCGPRRDDDDNGKARRDKLHLSQQARADLLPCSAKDDSAGCSSCVGSRGTPGDPCGLLPPPDTRRQVGIRWPRGPCHVILQLRGTSH